MNKLQSTTKFYNINFDTDYYLYYLPQWEMGVELYEEYPTGIIPVSLASAAFEEDDDESWLTYTFYISGESEWDDGIEIDTREIELLLFESLEHAEEFRAKFEQYVEKELNECNMVVGSKEHDDLFVADCMIEYADDYDFFYSSGMKTIPYDDLLYRNCVFHDNNRYILAHCVKNSIWFSGGWDGVEFNQYYTLDEHFSDNEYFVCRNEIKAISESQQLG